MHYLGGRMGKNPPHIVSFGVACSWEVQLWELYEIVFNCGGRAWRVKVSYRGTAMTKAPWMKMCFPWACRGTPKCLFPDPISYSETKSLHKNLVWTGLNCDTFLFFLIPVLPLAILLHPFDVSPVLLWSHNSYHFWCLRFFRESSDTLKINYLGESLSCLCT